MEFEIKEIHRYIIKNESLIKGSDRGKLELEIFQKRINALYQNYIGRQRMFFIASKYLSKLPNSCDYKIDILDADIVSREIEEACQRIEYITTTSAYSSLVKSSDLSFSFWNEVFETYSNNDSDFDYYRYMVKVDNAFKPIQAPASKLMVFV
jgi:hypothetical protein